MKTGKKYSEKIAYWSFYLAVMIEVIIVLLDKSSYVNPVEGRLFQFTFVLFLIKICLTRYTKREYMVIGLFIMFGVLSYLLSGRNETVRIIVFIASCKDIDMRECLKRVFYITLAGSMVIIFLSIIGIYGTVSLTQDYGRGMIEKRYTLGMGHPNALQCMIWSLTVLGVYLYADKMKWYHYVIALIINLGFFEMTGSKTSLIGAVFAIIYAGMYRFIKNDGFQRIAGLFGILVTLGSIVISVFISINAHYVYEYDWSIDTQSFMAKLMKRMDGVLTGRIRSLCDNERWEGTITTWKMFSEPANNYYFDMGWIRLFYWYGVIPALVVIGILIIWMIWSYRNKQYIMICLIASVSLYTIFEAHVVSVYIARNYLFFLMGSSWYLMLSPQIYGGKSEGKG